MYTGVRLRTNAAAGPLPPADRDLQLPFIESQITAVPEDPGAFFLCCGACLHAWFCAARLFCSAF
jgi:hypothetical protein